MSDRSDETGPAPETSGGDGAAGPSRADPEPPGVGLPSTAGVSSEPPPDRRGAPRDTGADPQEPRRALPDRDATRALPAADAAPSPPRPDATRTLPAADTAPADSAPDDSAPDDSAPTDSARSAERPDADAVPNRHGHTADFDHPNGRPFLRARGLTAAGRQGPIFTDVSLTASLGQVVAVCGDGGDGRSSLLLALSGRFPLRGGTLEVDGQTRPGQIRRRFTVAQAGPPIRFDPYHTVASCIKETIAVSKGAATRANVHAWLDRLAVGVDTGDTFGFLPRIDQVRFAVACAAACRTPAVVVDDTDSGLDTSGSERVFEALRTVADAGQLVIAACTRPDPPADTVVDLRCQHETAAPARRRGDHAAPRRHRREDDRNGGPR
ncbi:hypothetical protein LO763_08390 [Glycomyces sp. A-F 0318]|uniref:ATP-binding cassette domain-containing protein n=1 Tax=Glycomyces amatae TaxID=2881355 RepID=UPI001E5E8717|nr:ABC transporter ATP-binding protein [Glycomyces amatae]MCD0443643.1 hypothetical protein [Glycomyces amatae]